MTSDQVVRARMVKPGVGQQHSLDHRAWRKLKATYRSHCAARHLVCWLCRQPIDYSLKSGRMCFEADHFHPRSLRPDLWLVWANLRPSHQCCNRSRQAKDVGTHQDWVVPSW